MTLKPKKSEEQKTFRDFLREKYAGDSTTSDVELLQRLFEDFINRVGQDEFNKDDKSKKVIGVDDGELLPLALSSQQWFLRH
ncbi:hypothetical protein [uncultured Porphyromonas sp.]|uniref:hypothetical protein n=1 Tax=uncultured Porphyromonas sp. TaxID=159274 RepID=UPI0026205AF8|nr:hypothetical protein [uncultured Porphyromonas sp.]